MYLYFSCQQILLKSSIGIQPLSKHTVQTACSCYIISHIICKPEHQKH